MIFVNITEYYRKVNLHIDITVQDEIQLFHPGDIMTDIEHRQDILIGWNLEPTLRTRSKRTNHHTSWPGFWREKIT